MHLYRWWSEALRQHSQGHIIVCAASVADARQLALQHVEATIKAEWPWLWDDAFDSSCPDREDYDKKVAEFSQDLEKEPELLPGWIMIPGDC